MKAHIGTDTGKGLVHSVIVTDAGVHDSKVMDELLHGEEKAVYGDKAYAGEDRQKECESRGIEWCVKRKAYRWKQLSEEDEEYNHRQGKVRAKGEHQLPWFLSYTRIPWYGKPKSSGLSL